MLTQHTPFPLRPVASGFAALVLLAACSGGADTNANEAAPAIPAMSVEVIEIERQSINAMENLPGRARASSEAEIRPQVTGLIQERLFIEGETVKQGQPLYSIDSGDYVAARDSAQAALERSKAAAALSQETANRYKSLVDINAVSRQEYDEAFAAARQADADIAIQKAALDTAELNLSRTTVRSPIEGQIGRSNVTPGALVTQNQATSLAQVVRLDPIYADLNVPSRRLLEFRQMMADGKIETIGNPNDTRVTGPDAYIPVTIRLDNGADYEFRGQLQFREVSVDENDGTIAVRVSVPNPEGLILPGMYLNAEFSVGQYENAIAIPQQSVSRDARGQASVFIANPEGVVEQRNVEIIDQSGNSWVIGSGLAPGDNLIVSHLQSLRPGTPVQFEQASPDNALVSSAAPTSQPE